MASITFSICPPRRRHSSTFTRFFILQRCKIAMGTSELLTDSLTNEGSKFLTSEVHIVILECHYYIYMSFFKQHCFLTRFWGWEILTLLVAECNPHRSLCYVARVIWAYVSNLFICQAFIFGYILVWFGQHVLQSFSGADARLSSRKEPSNSQQLSSQAQSLRSSYIASTAEFLNLGIGLYTRSNIYKYKVLFFTCASSFIGIFCSWVLNQEQS